MVNYCTVNGCNSKSTTPGVRFHRFPKQRSFVKNWCLALHMQGRKITKWSVVCSRHFLPSDYRTFSGYREGIYTHPPLKKDAIPSQNLPQFLKIELDDHTLAGSRHPKREERDTAKLGSGAKTGSTAVSATNPRPEVEDGDASESSSEDSRSQTLPSKAGKRNDVICKCGQAAPLATVRTQGPNYGRTFYKCGNLSKCLFFRWADNQPPVLKRFRRVVMNGVDQIISTLCRCNYPAKLLGNDKSSNLRGFFGCGNPKGRSCNFFQWAKTDNSASTQTANGGKTGRAAAPATYMKDVSGSDDHDGNTEESSSRSPNEMLPSNDDETNDILCMCGHVALLRTVKTPGQNCGRTFYMCGNMRKCIFFRWCDEKSSASPAVMNTVVENVTVTCQCNQPAKLEIVYKAGPNTGRQFFACANQRGQCCTFFQWADRGR